MGWDVTANSRENRQGCLIERFHTLTDLSLLLLGFTTRRNSSYVLLCFFRSSRTKALCKEDDFDGELDRNIVAKLMQMLNGVNRQKFTLHFTVKEKFLRYGLLSFQVNSITQIHTKTNVNTSSNNKEPEDKDMDNTNESDKRTDTPSSAKEHEGPSKIAASKNGSQGTSKKPSKRDRTEANKSTSAK
ncbi:hypothetical protein TRIUR3_16770 [Triticum urartu]|uniref:Uncharacterized protein n=1 Tax=Triticum urartu TaxID=4572 RepID=M7YNP1_TRIUA|nr:hypothetical protein TRIUR3_16770 [Triticum urartu]